MPAQSAMVHALEPEAESFAWLNASRGRTVGNKEMQEQLSQLTREVSALTEAGRFAMTERTEIKLQLANVHVELTKVQLELARLSGARGLAQWLLGGILGTLIGLAIGWIRG